MKAKSFLSMLLTAALCLTLALPAAAKDDMVTDTGLNISYCEAVRTAVVILYGEQPQVMDAHYALPYMNIAKEKDLTEEIPQTEWNRQIMKSELNALLSKVTDTTQNKAVTEAIGQLIINAVTVLENVPVDLSGTPTFVRNGNIMIPVRKVGEALGYTVTWDGANPDQVKLDDGRTKTTIYIGQDSYYMASSQATGLTQAKPLGTAPMLVDGYTYVPAEMFHILQNKRVITVTDGVLNLK